MKKVQAELVGGLKDGARFKPTSDVWIYIVEYYDCVRGKVWDLVYQRRPGEKDGSVVHFDFIGYRNERDA